MITYHYLQPEEAAMMFNEGYEVEAKLKDWATSRWEYLHYKHSLDDNYIYRIAIED